MKLLEQAKTICSLLRNLLNRHKILVLTGAIAVTLTLGIWLAVSPSIEKQKMLAHQNALLASIENGIGMIILDERFASGEVDYYDDDGNGSLETDSAGSSDTPLSEPAEVMGIGILTIECIDLKLPVTDGVSAAQLKVAAGWVPQTASIGEEGNAVIAGHRSYTYGHFFNCLGELSIGDIIVYQSIDGDVIKFEVIDILVVLPGDPVAFEQPVGERQLTLLTCTPVRVASHRLLIRAKCISERE